MSTAVYEIPVHRIDGVETTLSEFTGKVALIVNVASKCGLTKQYEALEKLYKEHRDAGLVVLGFPANDFAGQEPGTNEEIATFCTTNFSVDFPMFEKITVTGEETHPLYRTLIEAKPEAVTTSEDSFRDKLDGYLKQYGTKTNPAPGILWNFEKFLVGRDGTVVARFSPEVTPDDPVLASAVEAELAKG